MKKKSCYWYWYDLGLGAHLVSMFVDYSSSVHSTLVTNTLPSNLLQRTLLPLSKLTRERWNVPDSVCGQFHNIYQCHLHHAIDLGPTVGPVLVTLDLQDRNGRRHWVGWRQRGQKVNIFRPLASTRAHTRGALLKFGHHYDAGTSLLPHHAPEVTECFLAVDPGKKCKSRNLFNNNFIYLQWETMGRCLPMVADAKQLARGLPEWQCRHSASCSHPCSLAFDVITALYAIHGNQYHPGMVIRYDIGVSVLGFVDLAVRVVPGELLTRFL